MSEKEINTDRDISNDSQGPGTHSDIVAPLKKFAEQVDAILSDADEARFWDCGTAFKGLLNSGFVLDLVNQELAKTAANPLYMPISGGSEIDMVIMFEKNYSAGLKVLEPYMKLSNRLFSNTENVMMGLVDFPGSGLVNMEEFEQPTPFPNDLPENHGVLLKRPKTQMRVGEIYNVRAASDIFRFISVDQPVILLMFSSPSIVPLRWEYNRETLLPQRATSASSKFSRIKYVAELLGEIGNEESLSALKSLVTNENHYVRWAAVQNIFRLDYEEGLKLVEDCLVDGHPHIRKAAAQSLNKINAFKN